MHPYYNHLFGVKIVVNHRIDRDSVVVDVVVDRDRDMGVVDDRDAVVGVEDLHENLLPTSSIQNCWKKSCDSYVHTVK